MQWERGQSIWKQIETILVDEIRRGVYKPGDKLPTEHQLAGRFDVNRHTVRNAIASMADQQVIRVEQGRGIFVQEPILSYPVSQRTRFSQIVSGRHRLPDKMLLGSCKLKVPKAIAEPLQIKTGIMVVRVETLAIADEQPLAHSVSHLPAPRFEGIAALLEEKKSLTDCFKDYGIEDYNRHSTRIIAQMPSTKLAQHLKQPKNRPILQTESVDVDPSGTPIQHVVTSFASDRVQLLIGDQGE